MTDSSAQVAVAEVLLRESPAGVVVFEGRTGRCVLANQALADMVGGTVEALRSHNFRTLRSWRDSGVTESAENTLRDGVPRSREATLRTSFGRRVSLEFSVSRFDVSDAPHVLVVVSDRTQAKAAERALLVREEELRTLVDTFPDLIVRYDADLHRTYVNPAWERASGLKSTDVVNVPAAEIPKVPVATDSGYVRKIRQALKSGTPQKEDFSWVNANGERLFLEYVMVPEHDRAGTVVGVLAVGHDLTARKKAEEELTRHRDRLEELVQERTGQLIAAKVEAEQAFHELQLAHARILQQEKMASIGQLAAGIAHEINTPAQYLSDNLDFLQQSFGQLVDAVDAIDTGCGPAASQADLAFLVEEIPNALQESLAGVQRIATIVSAMKDFAHPSDDRPAAEDLARLVNSAVEMTRNEWKHVAQLEISIDPQAAMVTCLRDRLVQVLLNLVVNAAHAIGETDRDPSTGRIRISARSDGEWVEIQVHDNGCGIPDELHRRVFEPFFTTKPVGRGTGQGLAIAYDIIVNVHQGQLRVDSTVGAGATFTLRLPAQFDSKESSVVVGE